jgi:hypothetical protein
MRANGGIRTPDQLITNQLLWPAELHWHTILSNTSRIAGYILPKNDSNLLIFKNIPLNYRYGFPKWIANLQDYSGIIK